MISEFEIFVISLKRYCKISARRTERITDALTKLGVKKINFVGINGLKLANKKIKQSYYLPKFMDYNLGNHGASLSHICALQIIKIRKIKKHVIVFEEDVVLDNPNFFSILNNHLPIDYDLALLHTYWPSNFYRQTISNQYELRQFDQAISPLGYDSFGPRSRLVAYSSQVSDKQAQDNKDCFFKKITNPLKDFCGMSCYAVNGKNIDKIIHNLLPIDGSIDWYVWRDSVNYKTINRYIANPTLKLCRTADDCSIRNLLDNYGKQNTMKIIC